MDHGQPVRFGVFLTPEATERPLKVAVLADELGFDVIGIQDHPYQRRFFDTWTLLTAVAMRTERITVFPDVINVPLRPPAVLAKSAASLDILSGGRLELGLGAGGFWDGIEAWDGPRRTAAESVSALEEAIQVIRLIWSGRLGIRFDGNFYRLKGAHSGPLPAHPIGVWLGAYKPRMLSLVGRLADGWVPSYGYVKEAQLEQAGRRIDEAAMAAGRDPRAIRRVLNAGFMDVEQLVGLVVDVGMDTILVGDDPDEMRTFMSDVAPKVREEVEARRSRRAD
ncbi:MAG TPA: LLM class flavin-dependent oxidoreductase [Candidatus Dormibacteraeota bacterium]|nr:LLM class flavin-dependent oxidoreductase [Candidatus Dormibacteraeota bacterium]